MMEGAAEGGADVSTLSDSFLTTGAGQFVVEGEFSLRKKEKKGRNFKRTRMHSSGMRTVRCSGRLGGGGVCPGGVHPPVGRQTIVKT